MRAAGSGQVSVFLLPRVSARKVGGQEAALGEGVSSSPHAGGGGWGGRAAVGIGL